MSDIFTRAGKEFYALMLANALPGATIRRRCSLADRLYNQRGIYEHELGRDEYFKRLRECNVLLGAADKIRPRCLPEHFESGKKFLNGLLWTPNGNQRKTAQAKEFQPADTQVLCGAKWITWVGGFERAVGNGLQQTLPIYEVHDGTGRFFAYVMSPWQSGSYFEIVDHV